MGGRGDDDTTVQRKAQFDFALPCPLGGYKIQPNELMRLASTYHPVPEVRLLQNGRPASLERGPPVVALCTNRLEP